MNEFNYITSGVLQDYCLGFLTEKEERSVESMCRDYPEVAKELELLQEALKDYLINKKQQRQDELRMKVWKAVKKLWEGDS
jgi:SRSO17 transposase